MFAVFQSAWGTLMVKTLRTAGSTLLENSGPYKIALFVVVVGTWSYNYIRTISMI